MNTKLIVGLIVVLVVAVAVYFFSPQADAPTVEDVTDAETSEASEEDPLSFETMGTSGDTASDNSSAAQQTTMPPPQTTPSAPTLPYSATIIYDGGRFIPDEVTIVEGGTVRFINNSEYVKMWIASNNHPTHTIYPIKTDSDCKGSSFDQCASVGLSGSWSFKFDRFGDWGFHNHERGKDTGKVHVLRVADYLESL